MYMYTTDAKSFIFYIVFLRYPQNFTCEPFEENVVAKREYLTFCRISISLLTRKPKNVIHII